MEWVKDHSENKMETSIAANLQEALKREAQEKIHNRVFVINHYSANDRAAIKAKLEYIFETMGNKVLHDPGLNEDENNMLTKSPEKNLQNTAVKQQSTQKIGLMILNVIENEQPLRQDDSVIRQTYQLQDGNVIRKEMEAIYMLAFKINLLLSDDEFSDKYVSVSS
jgi:hypothetical protein